MKYYILILLFCFSLHMAAQNGFSICEIKNSVSIDADSVILSYEVFYDKETSVELDAVMNNQSYIKRVKLSEKNIISLNRLIYSKTSYKNKEIAHLNHSDIFIYYYKDNAPLTTISISSITRNIVFINNGRIIKSNFSKSFEKYLTKLLREHKIWSSKMTFTY